MFIFSELLTISLNEDNRSLDSEDGLPCIIPVIDKQVLKLLKGDIDSLKIPTFLKKALHKLKSFLFLIDDKKAPKESKDKDGS